MLDLRDFAHAATGKCWKFTGLGPDAKNAVGKPPEVVTTESDFDATGGKLHIAALSVELYRFNCA